MKPMKRKNRAEQQRPAVHAASARKAVDEPRSWRGRLALVLGSGAVLTTACAHSTAPERKPAQVESAASGRAAGANLQGFRLDLPCKGEKFKAGEECHWDPGLAQTSDPAWKLKLEQTRTFDGRAGALYDVTLRVRGVVEPKNFVGGEVRADHFQTGGTPVANHYNFYKIQISDPPAAFTVNRHVDKVAHFVFVLDYEVTVPIRGGAGVMLGAYDSNDIAIANHQGLTVPEIASSPFDGQFFQIDVVKASIRPQP